jgi:hypothetical protein
VVDGQDVDFSIAHDAINDTVRAQHDLADRRKAQFGHLSSRLWEFAETGSGRNKAPNDHACPMRGVLRDECLNCCQVVLGALSPRDRRHDRKRLATSS